MNKALAIGSRRLQLRVTTQTTRGQYPAVLLGAARNNRPILPVPATATCKDNTVPPAVSDDEPEAVRLPHLCSRRCCLWSSGRGRWGPAPRCRPRRWVRPRAGHGESPPRDYRRSSRRLSAGRGGICHINGSRRSAAAGSRSLHWTSRVSSRLYLYTDPKANLNAGLRDHNHRYNSSVIFLFLISLSSSPRQE